MLRKLFDYTATQLSLTKGTNWHEGPIPDGKQDDCSALLERVGLPRDPYNTALRYFRFQIVSRSRNKTTARTEAHRIFDWMVELRGIQLTGWYLYDVVGNEPADIGKDEHERHTWSANVTVSAKKET